MLEPNLTLFVTVALVACFIQVATVVRNESLRNNPGGSLEGSNILGLPTPLGVLTALTVLAVTFALFPSDPRGWSLERLVLYLATPSLDPIRILGVVLIGAALFFFTVFALWAAGGRAKPKGRTKVSLRK